MTVYEKVARFGERQLFSRSELKFVDFLAQKSDDGAAHQRHSVPKNQ
jgi:hypothetical protein